MRKLNHRKAKLRSQGLDCQRPCSQLQCHTSSTLFPLIILTLKWTWLVFPYHTLSTFWSNLMLSKVETIHILAFFIHYLKVFLCIPAFIFHQMCDLGLVSQVLIWLRESEGIFFFLHDIIEHNKIVSLVSSLTPKSWFYRSSCSLTAQCRQYSPT